MLCATHHDTLNIMKALTYTSYGLPDVFKIKDVPKPSPEDRDVLVRVHATTVNRTDCGITSACYVVSRLFSGLLVPKKNIPGTDFAGTVCAVGKDVSDFCVGDRVFGFHDEGLSSHAAYLTISEGSGIGHIPQGIDFAVAAASLEGAHYAYNFLKKVDLGKGQKVLVHGATGAIGSAITQFLVDRGVDVTATCRTQHIQAIKDLGVTRVIDYTTTDFTQEDAKYNHICDAVGKSSYRQCRPLLSDGGTYTSSELGSYGANIWLAVLAPLLAPLTRNTKVVFPLPTDVKGSIMYISEKLTDKSFVPLIDRCYQFADIIDAYRYVHSGQKVGNVVITYTQ